MTVPGSPTVRRRRLASELREIRESKGKSGDAVAAALKWSPSKISRYERARTGLQPREVERLLDYYEITGPRRTLLLALAKDAAQKGWWEEFADRLSPEYQEFIGLARQEGWLRLRILTLNGQPAGAFYGFRYGRKYYFYQSGFDEAFLRQSVGLVTIGLTIREAIDEGAAEYDMLHGDESYKLLWANEVRPLFRFELYPPGVIGRVHRDSAIAVATTKKIVKRALYAPLNR